MPRISVLASGFAVLAGFAIAAAAQGCPASGLHVQVLGSGGPEMSGARAQSGHLLWVSGKARVLVNAGAGVALRLREAGADLREIELVLLTALHPDTAGDLPVLLEAMRRSGRTATLLLLGPSAAGDVRLSPGTRGLAAALLAQPYGAYRQLDPLLSDGTPFRLSVDEVGGEPREPHRVYSGSELGAWAAPLPEERALAWRVETQGRAAAFFPPLATAGPGLAMLARGSRIVFAQLPAPAADESLTPALAVATGTVPQLVLGGRSLAQSPGELAAARWLRRHYGGEIGYAEDLACYALD